MIPTIIGLAVFLLGWWLFRQKDILALLCATIALGLLEGSAAIILPALNGSSIQPGRVMLGFLAIATFLEIKDRAPLAKEALIQNFWLVVFCVYGAISAFIMPRIFAGQIDVVPLRSSNLRHLLDAYPLAFSSQNITTAVYLIGTGLMAFCAYVAVRQTRDISPLVKLAVGVTLAHAAIGILGVLLRGTPWDLVVQFFRNGSYSQLSQATESFVRIAGFMPEASNFARFGVVWMILSFELWLRHVRPLWTGIAAAVMFGTLLLSTSSTAYVGIAAYGAILLIRSLAFPAYLKGDKLFTLFGVALAAIIALMALLLFSTAAAEEFEKMILQMTVEKADSLSGQQRAFWALQGFEAFKTSYGLGIGAGSFRSSSIIMAILGGIGAIGMFSFVAYIAKTLWPLSTNQNRDFQNTLEYKICASAAWSAFAGLLPAMVMQPSPDPGMEFAAFAGIALGLRYKLRVAGTNMSVPNESRGFVERRSARLEANMPATTPQAGWRHVSR